VAVWVLVGRLRVCVLGLPIGAVIMHQDLKSNKKEILASIIPSGFVAPKLALIGRTLQKVL
jgi:hypothetical protein